eukprot:10746893-Prorocentrum_lima.AAC.1
MTSSLVGSEMCIRDRISTVLRDEVVRAAPVPTGRGSSTRVFLSPDPVSVSYTHLTLPTICSV